MASDPSLDKHLLDRIAQFAGREWVLEQVAEWLNDLEAPRVLLITGEPGCGKTALAAWLTAPSEALPSGPLKDIRSVWTARHFCMAEGHDNSLLPTEFARLLAQQISERVPEFGPAVLEFVAPTVKGEARADINWGEVIGIQIKSLIISSPDPKEVYHRSVRKPLELLCEGKPNARFFILVDALDEALTTGAPRTIIDLLAGSEDFPPQVRFLLTSRPEPRVLEKFRRARLLKLSDPTFRSEVDADIRAYIAQRWVPSLSDSNMEALVAAADGNFLYVRWLLDEVVRGIRNANDLTALPIGLHALYHDSLYRLVRDAGPNAWPERFQPLLGRLSVAASEVPMELLGEWTNQQAEVAANLSRVYQFVEPSTDGLAYRLYHRSMADFLALPVYNSNAEKPPNPYHTPPRLQHRAIVDFYLQHFQGKWQACHPYGLQHLAWHLKEAGKVDDLHQLLLTFDWLQTKLEATDINRLMADFEHLPEDSELQTVQSAIRLSAHVINRDPCQLAGQLSARLIGNANAKIKAILAQAVAEAPRPWLRSVRASLAQPGGALIRTLEGHIGWTTGVAAAPNGRRAISSSDDNSLRLWDLESGQCLRTLEGHADTVTGVAIMPDGRRALSASWDKTVWLWDMESGQRLRTLEGHTGSTTGVAAASDGRRALSASKDKTLRVWDLESGQCLHTLEGHSDAVTGVAITPDGRCAVSASADKTLRVWDLDNGQCLRALQGHGGGVTAVAIAPDGRCAVSASKDKTLRVWDLDSGQCLRALEGHGGGVTGVAIAPDGRYAVSASYDDTLKVWELESGQRLQTLEGHSGFATGVAITPDGCRAVSVSQDKTVRVWNLESAKRVPTPEYQSGQSTELEALPHERQVSAPFLAQIYRHWERHSSPDERIRFVEGYRWIIDSVAITPNGRRAVSASWDKTLRIWDLDSGQCLRALQGHGSGVNEVAITPDGRCAVSASRDTTLRVWDLDSGRCLRTLQGHGKEVTEMAIGSDGHCAVSASEDTTLRVWDLDSGQCLRALQGHGDSVTGVAITPNGRCAVSASRDTTLRVWDLDSGQCLRALQGHGDWVTGVAIATDGRCAVSASRDKTLGVWDLDSGHCLRALQGHGSGVNEVATTPDGRCAVSASSDDTLKVWDLESGKCLYTLQGHSDWISGMSITRYGNYVASASHDNTLRVWDLKSGERIATFTGESPMWSCAGAPDGRMIVAGDQSGQMHILNLVELD
jgi:WD40 repeat protein